MDTSFETSNEYKLFCDENDHLQQVDCHSSTELVKGPLESQQNKEKQLNLHDFFVHYYKIPGRVMSQRAQELIDSLQHIDLSTMVNKYSDLNLLPWELSIHANCQGHLYCREVEGLEICNLKSIVNELLCSRGGRDDFKSVIKEINILQMPDRKLLYHHLVSYNLCNLKIVCQSIVDTILPSDYEALEFFFHYVVNIAPQIFNQLSFDKTLYCQYIPYSCFKTRILELKSYGHFKNFESNESHRWYPATYYKYMLHCILSNYSLLSDQQMIDHIIKSWIDILCLNDGKPTCESYCPKLYANFFLNKLDPLGYSYTMCLLESLITFHHESRNDNDILDRKTDQMHTQFLKILGFLINLEMGNKVPLTEIGINEILMFVKVSYSYNLNNKNNEFMNQILKLLLSAMPGSIKSVNQMHARKLYKSHTYLSEYCKEVDQYMYKGFDFDLMIEEFFSKSLFGVRQFVDWMINNPIDIYKRICGNGKTEIKGNPYILYLQNLRNTMGKQNGTFTKLSPEAMFIISNDQQYFHSRIGRWQSEFEQLYVRSTYDQLIDWLASCRQ